MIEQKYDLYIDGEVVAESIELQYAILFAKALFEQQFYSETLPQNAGVQATFCMCEKCGEAYEADREHVCKKVNSCPVPKEGTYEY